MTKEIKEEIKERLAIMNIMPEVKRQILNGDVAIWERQNAFFSAVHYSLKLNLGQEPYDQLKEQIEAFEEMQKGHSKVYMVQKTYTEFGELITLFFVDDREMDYWEQEKEDLRDGIAFAYVINQDEPLFNEFGSVSIVSAMGGIFIR